MSTRIWQIGYSNRQTIAVAVNGHAWADGVVVPIAGYGDVHAKIGEYVVRHSDGSVQVLRAITPRSGRQ